MVDATIGRYFLEYHIGVGYKKRSKEIYKKYSPANTIEREINKFIMLSVRPNPKGYLRLGFKVRT